MGAARVYTWHGIAPNATVGIFVHGYDTKDVVAYSIVPYYDANEPPGAAPKKAAQMTEGETSIHVDGTIARTIFVENRIVGPQPYLGVDFNELYDRLP